MTLHRVARRVTVADEYAVEDARDVGVENRRPLSEGEAANRAGGVLANPLEGKQRFGFGGQRAAEPLDRVTSDRVQPPRPDVVAERVPDADDFLLVGAREGFEGRIAFEPFVILGQDAIDLRLLQHDFGHEDPVRVARFAPWERAAVAPVPVEKPATEPATERGIGKRQGRRTS